MGEKAKKVKISTFTKDRLGNSLDSIFNTKKQAKILLYLHGIKANDTYSQKIRAKKIEKTIWN